MIQSLSRFWIVRAILIGVLGAVLGGCRDRPSATAPEAESIGAIVESPESFFGRRVRVGPAGVELVRTARLFTVDEDNWLAAPDLMVLIPVPAGDRSVRQGEQVTVEGTVRQMRGAAFKRDYSWWDEGAFTAEIDMIGARPVLVADSVRTRDGAELVAEAVRSK